MRDVRLAEVAVAVCRVAHAITCDVVQQPSHYVGRALVH